MKKKIILSLFAILAVVSLTACGKKDKKISISCEGKSQLMEGVNVTNKSIYNFDKDQKTTDYEVITISVYDNEETYKFYKESAEETAKTNSNNIEYTVKSDDNTKTVTFSYKVTVNDEMTKDIEEPDYFMAKKVLERTETLDKTKCTLTGIKREELK